MVRWKNKIAALNFYSECGCLSNLHLRSARHLSSVRPFDAFEITSKRGESRCQKKFFSWKNIEMKNYIFLALPSPYLRRSRWIIWKLFKLNSLYGEPQRGGKIKGLMRSVTIAKIICKGFWITVVRLETLLRNVSHWSGKVIIWDT